MPREIRADLEKDLFEALQKLDLHTKGDKVVKHVKSGTLYYISSMAYEEATLTPVVVYADYDLASLKFTRPLDEFIEKFVPLTKIEVVDLACEPRRI